MGVNTQNIIKDVCEELSEFLQGKNRAYGNSALSPLRCFSSASTEEQLFVRIDDKLSRIMRGSEYPGDDTIDDLIGYLVLLKVYKRMENDKKAVSGRAEEASGQTAEAVPRAVERGTKAARRVL